MRFPLTAALLACFALPASAGELRVRLSGLASSEGNVRIALFADAASFEAERQTAGVFLPANAAGVELVLSGLAPGTYSISSFHDVNGNAELDRNLMGIPTEPFGFSNNARGRFGPPSFDDMSFVLGDEPVALEIDLR